MEELEALCQEAARDLGTRPERPVPTAVILPLPDATRITTLPDFPGDDPSRFDLLDGFARQRMAPANAPCYGFLAEATLTGEGGGAVDVLMVVFGARRQRPRVSAAPLDDEGVGDFAPAEDLDPTAMPFLAPLQRAVDAAGPPDVTNPVLPS